MAKKKYIVVPRSPRAMENGIQTSKGKLDFDGKTGMYVTDDVASEIDTHHGEHGSNDVWVCEDERLSWHERNDSMTDGKNTGIHHYTFSGVDMTGIRSVRLSREVWVWVDSQRLVQKLVRREVAEQEGYEIVPEKARKARRKAEVQDE